MPDLDLSSLVQGRVRWLDSELDRNRPHIYGVIPGVVTDVHDCKGLGRVKVRFPSLSDRVESAWAKVAVPWAGQDRGSYFRPEVDDEVLVSFRHGDVRYPYVVGFLWSQQATPPGKATPPGPGVQPRRSELRSRSGHVLALDDTDGQERLTVQCHAGHKVVLDDDGIRLLVGEEANAVSVVIDSASRKISITAPQGSLDISAVGGSIAIRAAEIAVRSTGPLHLDGDPVRINCT
jgi:uncharacterized protein involved in type VI secretion and phage assembly